MEGTGVAVEGLVCPPRLAAGQHVRVVAPSQSRAIIGHDNDHITAERFADLGLTVSFGEHVLVCDEFGSSSIEERVADLHAAFADPDVDAIMTVIGGYNSHQLLPHLDMDLIRANPKILCGYSDITALQHGILCGAGLVTYSGPHWSSFGMRDHFEDNLAWFKACLMTDAPVSLHPSEAWTDDAWFLDQDERHPQPNDGWWVLQDGEAAGQLLGGNASTLALLGGTPWMPDLSGAILVVEDDFESDAVHVDRWVTSLLQQAGGDKLAGVLIGRFQTASQIGRDTLTAILAERPELTGIPMIANLDIGHTNPFLTFPVGGRAAVSAERETASVTITAH